MADDAEEPDVDFSVDDGMEVAEVEKPLPIDFYILIEARPWDQLPWNPSMDHQAPVQQIALMRYLASA